MRETKTSSGISTGAAKDRVEVANPPLPRFDYEERSNGLWQMNPGRNPNLGECTNPYSRDQSRLIIPYFGESVNT